MTIIDFSSLDGKKPNKQKNESLLIVAPETADDQRIPADKLVSALLEISPGKVNYTLPEAATALGVSPEFLRRRYYRGAINTTKLGDRVMINVFELSRLLERGVA